MSEAEQQRLNEALALRVRYWMSGLVLRFRPTSLDDLARLVEPNLRWHDKVTNEPYRTNKYRAYEKGNRSPRLSLVNKIDAIRQANVSGEGSKAEFVHVLLEILRGQPVTPQTCRRWLRSLSAEVQAIAHKAPPLLVGRKSSYWVPELRSLEYGLLRHRPGFDALALLTFVVQQAHRFGREDLAHQTGHELVRMLWQLSLDFDDRGLIVPFMTFFEKWVLPETRKGNVRLSLSDNILHRTEFLRFALKARMAKRKGPASKSAEGTELRRILTWGPWLDLFSLYAARCVPNAGCVLTNEEQTICTPQPNELERNLQSEPLVSMLIANRNQRIGSDYSLE